jgi:hypothetical protein
MPATFSMRAACTYTGELTFVSHLSDLPQLERLPCKSTVVPEAASLALCTVHSGGCRGQLFGCVGVSFTYSSCIIYQHHKVLFYTSAVHANIVSHLTVLVLSQLQVHQHH